jgi:hypothetical protein
MKRWTLSKAMPLAAAGLVSLAASAQIPKEGPIDWTICWGGPVYTVVATPQDRFGTYAVTGAMRASNGPAETMSLECIGTFESRGSSGKSQGYCVFQDAAGDRIFGTDDRDAKGYVFEFLGGSGKYAGITASGVIEPLAALRPMRDGTLQACRRLRGTYKMP